MAEIITVMTGSGMYTPVTLKFHDKPQKIVNKRNKNDHILTIGDLNGRKLPS